MNHDTHKKSIIIDDDDEIIIMTCKKHINAKNYIVLGAEQTPETNDIPNVEKFSDKTTTKSREELHEDFDNDLIVHKLLIYPSAPHLRNLYHLDIDNYACGYINLMFTKFILKICKTRSLKAIVGEQYDYYIKTARRRFKHASRFEINENKKKYYDHELYMQQNKNWELDLQVVINILSYVYDRTRKALNVHKLFNIDVYKYIHEHFNYKFITETDYMLCDHFNETPNIAFIIICICEYFEVFLKDLNDGYEKLHEMCNLSSIAKIKKIINSDSNLSKIVEIIFDRYDKPILAPNAIDCHYRFV